MKGKTAKAVFQKRPAAKRMIHLVILFVLLLPATALAGIAIDKENFPDEAFRTLVSSFDLDKDGFLIPDEFSAIKEIDCQKNPKIRDVTGIELFPELESLSCWECPLKKIDLSSNPALTFLDVCDCGLSSLDVTHNPKLVQLWTYGNSFTTLDLSKCPNMCKAVKNGIYNNDKNDGTACSYADEDEQFFLVVDKNITLKTADGTVISGKTGDSGKTDGSGKTGDSGKTDGSGKTGDSDKTDDSGKTGDTTGSDDEGDTGIGWVSSPVQGQTYLLGSVVPIEIHPTGSVALGGISISGSCRIMLGNEEKFYQPVSVSGTSYITGEFTPDSAGTYIMRVSLTYKLYGMEIDYSSYTRTFYVADPNAAEPESEAGADSGESPAGSGAETCKTHKYGKWIVIKKATYTAKGSKKRVCSVCGHVQKAEIAKRKVKAGSVLKDKTASYKILKGLKTAAYIAPLKKAVKTITVPASVKLAGKTYKVTSVLSKAFNGCSKLKTVTIGSNVTTIGTKAFAGCKKLTAVTIGKKVNSIGKQAFYGCSALKKISIKSSKLTYAKTGTKAFKGVSARVVVYVPAKKLKAYHKILTGRGIGKNGKILSAK